MTILTAQRWADNGAMIADVAKLGYLDGQVCDTTFGYGTFWKQWQPTYAVNCDIDVKKSPYGISIDFRKMPWGDGYFDAVVCDPPYRLVGTPSPEFDERYGTHVPMKWQDRHQLIRDGISECARVTRKYFLLKCMAQVVSGHKRWQDIEFTNHAATVGLTLVDRFDMLVTPRPQPSGRRQVHSQQNYSTLLIFRKGNS